MHDAGNTEHGAAARRPQVMLDADIAQKCRVLAGLDGVSVPDLVNARLRPVVEAEFATAVQRMNGMAAPAKG